jgi:hypothetical protein
MSNPVSEEELQVAEELLGAVLVLRQYGEEGLSPERSWSALDTKIEHFLRRDEPESAYYERFGDHDVVVDVEPQLILKEEYLGTVGD